MPQRVLPDTDTILINTFAHGQNRATFENIMKPHKRKLIHRRATPYKVREMNHIANGNHMPENLGCKEVANERALFYHIPHLYQFAVIPS